MVVGRKPSRLQLDGEPAAAGQGRRQGETTTRGGEERQLEALRHSTTTNPCPPFTMVPRAPKRSKTDAVVLAPAKGLAQPRLFAPFRALGFISNHVPLAIQTRSNKGAVKGPNISLVSCLGDAWAMWEGDKMGLVFVGESRRSPMHKFRRRLVRRRRRGCGEG